MCEEYSSIIKNIWSSKVAFLGIFILDRQTRSHHYLIINDWRSNFVFATSCPEKPIDRGFSHSEVLFINLFDRDFGLKTTLQKFLFGFHLVISGTFADSRCLVCCIQLAVSISEHTKLSAISSLRTHNVEYVFTSDSVQPDQLS